MSSPEAKPYDPDLDFSFRMTAGQIGSLYSLTAQQIGLIVKHIRQVKGLDLKALPYGKDKPVEGTNGKAWSQIWYNMQAVQEIKGHAVPWLKAQIGGE